MKIIYNSKYSFRSGGLGGGRMEEINNATIQNKQFVKSYIFSKLNSVSNVEIKFI